MFPRLQSMMQSNPGLMQQAMDQYKNMRPEDLEQAKRAMADMDPNTFAAQAQQQVAGRVQYIINVSRPRLQDQNV
jgi:hypothetical protein